MDMKACRDGRYKRSKQCYCVLSRVSSLSTLSIWRSKHAMHLMLCLLTLSMLVFVALTQHLIQSTMRCENCINSVDIDSIECIRDPCLVLTVSTYIVLMVWLKSPQSQLSKTFCGLKIHWKLRKLWAGMCGCCCDMDQNDTIGKIELKPLSSCQVIILIARMTFNCSTSCLMS